MSDTWKHILIQLAKVLLFVLLLVILFHIGLMIGYGGIGDGKPTGVFDGEVWNHITDFLKK